MEWLNNIAPTIIGLLGGAIGWFLKSKVEAKRRAEEALREEQAKTYTDILMPFAQLFTDLSPKSQQSALKLITSLDYRKKSFQLVLVGSDEVVRAWNKMWDTIYSVEKNELDSKQILLRFGEVLLAIRKGLGNDGTRMSSKDMLRWLIKDVDSL
jgi:hypothetical protein